MNKDKDLEVADNREVTQRKVALSREQVALLQNTICKDHTPDEVTLFVEYCQAKGLDPFGREVYSIKRSGKVTFQVGIDGLRGMAESTGEYNGQETDWADENGKWVDIWTSNHPPFAARVKVYRKGFEKPFVGIALWVEYKPASDDWMWKKMPSNQLAKCAEAISLRKAFPRKLGGLYASEEMEQADKGTSHPKIQPPRAKAVEVQAAEAQASVPEASGEGPWDAEIRPAPVGMRGTEKAALDAQRPEPKSVKSKFFTQLHKAAREHKVPDEVMKSLMWDFQVKSSKDLNDEQAAQLIKLIEGGTLDGD